MCNVLTVIKLFSIKSQQKQITSAAIYKPPQHKTISICNINKEYI